MAMLAPIKLSNQLSSEVGANRSNPIGLDTKDVDTASGPVSFVKLEKNAEWLLRATLGATTKGALRRVATM